MFKNRASNKKFHPVELLTSKQMLQFCEEKHLPLPSMYLNPVIQDIFMALNIARTHPKLFNKKVLAKLENRFEKGAYYDMNGFEIKMLEGDEAY